MLRPSELLRVLLGRPLAGFPLSAFRLNSGVAGCAPSTPFGVRIASGVRIGFHAPCGRAVPSDPRVLWVAHAAAADAALLRELLATL